MDKHVPGPWQVTHPTQQVWNIRDQDGSLIAVYHGANADDNPQNEATARLIAAAPELLSACEAAYHALRSYQYGNSAPDLAKEIADRLEITLSEARGE